MTVVGGNDEEVKMAEKEQQVAEKVLIVSSSPHLIESGSSRRVMFEVVIGCLPALGAALWFFRGQAAVVVGACLVAALATEWIFNAARKKEQTVLDGSVIVTALILGLSLPPTIPFWAAGLGTIVAVAIAKMLFGGLGSNIFNPAMVGRAFLMACFGMMMTTWQLPVQQRAVADDMNITQATPLALAKAPIKDAANPDKPANQKAVASEVNDRLEDMFWGRTSGSIGETSALMWLIGGVFLLVRRTITWHVPFAVLASAGLIGGFAWHNNPEVYVNPLVHFCGGGMMMCAFFIATDPVTCPLSKLGRLIFGVGVGSLIMLIRLQGGYPEGVMYAILLMNSMTPLLDRWTRPTPMGGHVRVN
jgi:electron transport complex protein RnfD